ncbi:MAG TPA: cytochrome c [Acidobacteriota bacterium]|nr:cytochrome c [Acidobacteriota bacterium]HRR25832.1 cytochrome c [Acidobacteriota bacterium]HRR56251.1 cytochrome c [Acidobacteriota bacterium]HRV07486.1 cytochrome c [Acidobacteriota bacterium]
MLVTGLGETLIGQDTAQFFRTNCYSCHSIGGGRVTGPDLKDVTTRKDRAWLVNFILNPKETIDSGDPYAQELFKEARGVIMPRVPALDKALAESLLDLIEKESRLEQSNFPGLQVSDRPVTTEEIAQGRNVFRGATPPGNGGPSCINCHHVSGLSFPGGGRIGPDLTKVFERLGGRQSLASWLMAPATPTMGRVFRDRPLTQDDIVPLAAFLEDTARNRAEEPAAAQQTGLLFVAILGGLLSATLLAGMLKRFQRQY